MKTLANILLRLLSTIAFLIIYLVLGFGVTLLVTSLIPIYVIGKILVLLCIAIMIFIFYDAFLK